MLTACQPSTNNFKSVNWCPCFLKIYMHHETRKSLWSSCSNEKYYACYSSERHVWPITVFFCSWNTKPGWTLVHMQGPRQRQDQLICAFTVKFSSQKVNQLKALHYWSLCLQNPLNIDRQLHKRRVT